MTSRFERMSEPARALLAELDELDMAEDLATANAAIGRARRLHRKVVHRGRFICAECSAYDGGDSTDNPPMPFPCDTVLALGPA